MNFDVHVEDRIAKTKTEVFNAIVDRHKLTKFFVSRASHDMVEGNTVIWHFDDYGVTIDVKIQEIVKNETIRFRWGASGSEATVSIELSEEDEHRTLIKITESKFGIDKEGILKAMQQTQGWTDFICSLKAYLYTGINLRNGKMNKSEV